MAREIESVLHIKAGAGGAQMKYCLFLLFYSFSLLVALFTGIALKFVGCWLSIGIVETLFDFVVLVMKCYTLNEIF